MKSARMLSEIDSLARLRFMTKFVVIDNGCWQWQEGCFRTGYGSFRYRGQSYPAHRFGYILLKGSIDPFLVLDHLCRNKKCVNPDHLEPVTVGENIRRGETGIANYSKQVCVNGHELTPQNTLIRKEGWRNCRTCHNLRRRRT